MRIAIVANDTQGGVQPYAALGIGLKRAGHDVQVVAPVDFEPLFTALGLRMAPLSGSRRTEVGAARTAIDRGPVASMLVVARELNSRIGTWTQETLDGCAGADVVTGGVGGMVVGLSVAEKLGIPFIPTHLQPVDAPTGEYPGALMAGMPSWLGRPGRVLSHRLTGLALWTPFSRPMALARRSVLGLAGPPTAADGQPVLYGFSPLVVPVPEGVNSRGDVRRVTGYWFAPDATKWTPPASLENFLAEPGPVVSVGFGSMSSKDPDAATALVIRAARAAGVRVVLLSGCGGLAGSNAALAGSDVYFADSVPHDWLFPRMDAVVHHGGAGTTGAALRAGVPAVVVPFTVDQPFWASRVVALGVGPKAIPRRRLSERSLADALVTVVGNDAMRGRAASLGERIRSERGVDVAIAYLTRGR